MSCVLCPTNEIAKRMGKVSELRIRNWEFGIVSKIKKTTFRLSGSRTNRLTDYPTILIILFSCGIIGVGYFTERSNFFQLFGIYSVLFILYYFLQKSIQKPTLIFSLGVFFRVLLVFSTPALSDDFYRFVWDGRLLAHGINPYIILPAEFIHNPDYQKIIGDVSLFKSLNSPNYFTVYPSLNQYIFGISAWLAEKNLFLNIIFLRIFILVGEILTLFLLTKLSKKKNLPIGLYVFNPLIIIELVGNLHFEGLVMAFLLLAYELFQKNRNSLSAISLAMAVSIKLLPLIFLPLIFKKLGFRQGLKYCLIVSVFCVLLFLPFVDNLLISGISSSLSLYFQKFEFNASVYYLVREMGYWIFGYNIISMAGKGIMLLSFVGILWISAKTNHFFEGCLFILSLYLGLATTVHPWYVSTLVGISIFTKFRYAIVWSFLVVLSYATYQTLAYTENLYLVAIEYVFVYGFFLYELRFKQKKSNISTF